MVYENQFFHQVGGISFSKFFKRKRKKRKTKKTMKKRRKNIRRTNRRRTNRRKTNRRRTNSIRKNTIKRTIKKNKKNPEGLGYNSKDIPYNVVMRGVDDNLWENKKMGWVKLDIN